MLIQLLVFDACLVLFLFLIIIIAHPHLQMELEFFVAGLEDEALDGSLRGRRRCGEE